MHSILRITENPLELIEFAGRNCTNTLDKLGESTEDFVRRLLKRGHESVLEHANMTVFFDEVSRGFTHELVRHRHAAFSQRSTRYAARRDKFDLKRSFLNENEEQFFNSFAKEVFNYLKKGIALEIPNDRLRQILPIGTLSPIVITANFREWRHIFRLRTASPAHWEIRQEMLFLLEDVKKLVPVVFEEL